MDREPVDWQERHSPTEMAEVKLSNERRSRHPARRRKGQARIWAEIEESGPLERAAVWIERGYKSIVGGMGYATMPQDRVDRAYDTGVSDIRAMAEHWYFEWGRECAREDPRIHPVTVAWLCEDNPLADIAQRYRVRKEKARQMMFDGLKLFAKGRGWG